MAASSTASPTVDDHPALVHSILAAVQRKLDIRIYHDDGTLNYDIPVDAQTWIEFVQFAGAGGGALGSLAAAAALSFWPVTLIAATGAAAGGEWCRPSVTQPTLSATCGCSLPIPVVCQLCDTQRRWSEFLRDVAIGELWLNAGLIRSWQRCSTDSLLSKGPA